MSTIDASNRSKRTGSRTPRVAIAGAGPGGLATAILLAAQGIEVDVFERRGRVGGRTSTLEIDDFRFDVGPTFFLYPQLLDEIFAAAGTRLKDEIELVRLDPQYRLHFEGGPQLDATPDIAKMEEEIARISPADALRLRDYFDDNAAKLKRLRPFLQKPFNSWRDLIDPRLLGALSAVRPWASLDQDLKRFFKDPRTRLAFSFQSKYLGMSPFRCPSLFSILSGLEYEYGVFHPIGGCGALSEVMARVARRLGARIHLNEPVSDLEFEGRKVKSLLTPSGRHAIDALVVNADFARAMKRLVPDSLRRRWTDRKIDSKKFSCSTFMMYLGIEGRFDNLAHHNIVMSREYEDNLKDIEQRHVLSESPSFYVQNACVTDPGLAPKGMSTLYVLIPVTHQHANVDWDTERSRYRQVALDRLKVLGITDVESRIRAEKIITPSDWDTDFEIHRGAVFNLAHNLGQLLHLRPRNRFEDLEGVYLTGGGTHPGSGLPVIFESARISSRLLLEDLGFSPGETLTPSKDEQSIQADPELAMVHE